MTDSRSTDPLPSFVIWSLRPRRSRGFIASATSHDHAEPGNWDILNWIDFGYDGLGRLKRAAQIKIVTDLSSENRRGANGGGRRSWNVQKVHSVSLCRNGVRQHFVTELSQVPASLQVQGVGDRERVIARNFLSHPLGYLPAEGPESVGVRGAVGEVQGH
jgi:hypothetical protein